MDNAITLFKQILSLFDNIARALVGNSFYATLFGLLLLGLVISLILYLQSVVKR